MIKKLYIQRSLSKPFDLMKAEAIQTDKNGFLKTVYDFMEPAKDLALV